MPMVRRHILVSTHSRLKAAGRQDNPILSASLCFNTQPPEGGWLHQQSQDSDRSSFNTQPPEGGWFITKISSVSFGWFQHTAARRRLEFRRETDNRFFLVSTHSRPKAAGAGKRAHQNRRPGFNTQPPEGGWAHGGYTFSDSHGFNTQPPEGGWTAHMVQEDTSEMFQHTAARRRLAFMVYACFLKSWFQHTAARRRLGKTMTRQYQACLFQHTAARRRLAPPAGRTRQG